MSRLLLAAVAAALLLPAAAAAQNRTVTTYGTAQVQPDIPDKATPEQLQMAIEAAETEALPKALDAARRRADVLAKAAGAQLGDVISMEEVAGGAGAGPFAFHDGSPFLFGPQAPRPALPLAVTPCPPRRRGQRRRCTVPAFAPAPHLKVVFALR